MFKPFQQLSGDHVHPHPNMFTPTPPWLVHCTGLHWTKGTPVQDGNTEFLHFSFFKFDSLFFFCQELRYISLLLRTFASQEQPPYSTKIALICTDCRPEALSLKSINAVSYHQRKSLIYYKCWILSLSKSTNTFCYHFDRVMTKCGDENLKRCPPTARDLTAESVIPYDGFSACLMMDSRAADVSGSTPLITVPEESTDWSSSSLPPVPPAHPSLAQIGSCPWVSADKCWWKSCWWDALIWVLHSILTGHWDTL